MHGTHFTESRSYIQPLIALPSAEPELHAVVEATSEAPWVRSVVQDLGNVVNEPFRDASAVHWLVRRQGLGRPQHADCNFLVYVRKPIAENVFDSPKCRVLRTRWISAQNQSRPMQC